MSARRRWWAFGAILLSMLTIGFDATILNVALPTLATALHAGTDGLQWMVDAYVLVFAGLLLPMGAIGDRYGRKRLMLTGLAVFGAASVLATFAGGTGTLVAARAVMGIGGPLGPIIGGYLLRHFWWGSVFLINVPVVLVALIAVALLVPESRNPAPPKIDLVGGVLSTAGLVSFVYGVIEVPQRGWG